MDAVLTAVSARDEAFPLDVSGFQIAVSSVSFEYVRPREGLAGNFFTSCCLRPGVPIVYDDSSRDSRRYDVSVSSSMYSLSSGLPLRSLSHGGGVMGRVIS